MMSVMKYFTVLEEKLGDCVFVWQEVNGKLNAEIHSWIYVSLDKSFQVILSIHDDIHETITVEIPVGLIGLSLIEIREYFIKTK